MNRHRPFEGPAGLLEESGIAIPLPHVRIDDAAGGRAVRTKDLSLSPSGLVLLASLIGTEGLPIDPVIPGGETHLLARLVCLAGRDQAIGGPSQHLAHGRLAHLQRRGDLALGVPGGIQLPRPHRASLDHGTRFVPPNATATSSGTTGSGHRRAAVSWRVAVRPVYASQRSTIICT
jgi:hypothetical protein